MHEHPAVYPHARINHQRTSDPAAKIHITRSLHINGSNRFRALPLDLAQRKFVSHHRLCRRIYQLSPPCEHVVSSIFVVDMNLLHILQVCTRKFAHTFEYIDIPTQSRRSVSPDSHLDVRFQPATGSASTSLASRACRMGSAGASRPKARSISVFNANVFWLSHGEVPSHRAFSLHVHLFRAQ